MDKEQFLQEYVPTDCREKASKQLDLIENSIQTKRFRVVIEDNSNIPPKDVDCVVITVWDNGKKIIKTLRFYGSDENGIYLSNDEKLKQPERGKNQSV